MSNDSSCIWQLTGDDTCALFYSAAKADIPQLIWYGEPCQTSISSTEIAALVDLPLPMAKLDTPVALDIFPQASSGIDCQPALRAHRNGRQFNHRLSCTSVETQRSNDDGSSTDTGSSNKARHHKLIVTLSDAIAELEVVLTFTLHSQSGVLGINTRLENTGDSALQLEWLAAATVVLPHGHSECLHLHGRWGLECQQHRQSIGPHRILLENNRGRTSHELYPAVITGEAGFGENHGDALAMHLAWSGSHRTIVEKLSDGRCYLQSGIALDVGEQTLSNGESTQTPSLYLARSSTSHNADQIYTTGLNGISQRMHQFARSTILPAFTRTPRPIHANSWEALYFDHDIDKLKGLVAAVSRLGAERFVLDDGWFPARRSDNAGLGDWTVDKTVYPEGLHPLVKVVRSAGMQFGLWFEPEMVNPDSDLYRNHPDWVCHLQHHDTPLARNQLALNLALSEVRDYLFDQISALVSEYSIDYIKWDQNRDLVMAGNGQTSVMRQQVTGCYQVIDRLCKQFPSLEIESCASGGARSDWGILQYTGRVWTSDSIDAVDRLRIQRGYSLFNPPEITGAHIGHEVAHLTGRAIDIHTRAVVALQGQFGFELNAAIIEEEEAATIRHYVALYKKHRDWIASSSYWRLESPAKHLLVNGMVDSTRNRSLWFIVAESSLSTTTPGKLLPRGLDADSQYAVQLVSDNFEQIAHYSKKTPAWMTSPCTISGALLMKIGLHLPIMPAQSALLIEVNAVATEKDIEGTGNT